MSGLGQWQPFDIDDDDIVWASELMGFGHDGFGKVGNDDSRLNAIRSMATVDFEACPGSGKTTLLVAKLAILANHWRHRRQGVCVLSHTNVARNEIGTRLGETPVGSALLRYPHFVGTIHSFVNEFLAVPWLRSKGNPIQAIDTEIALNHRMRLLPGNWKTAMTRRNLSEFALMYTAPDYTANNKGKLSPKAPLAQHMVAVAKASSEAGYFCYDEMFVWANELLDARPEVAAALRVRYPFVLVDEAQDNSEVQSALLHRVFLDGDRPSRRQRFGDSNQAIFGAFEDSGASTDQFPSVSTLNLPRSHRFNQTIADQVQGLGVVPQPLIGAGPSPSRIKTTPKAPIVFLFDDASVGHVLPRYGAHLVEEFSEDELRAGIYVAVAGVHESDRTAPVPCSMRHYAPHYDGACGRRDASQPTFAQYLARARFEVGGAGNIFPLVHAAASAVLRLASIAGADFTLYRRQSPHRQVLELLEDKADDYNALVELVVANRGDLSRAVWDTQGRRLAMSVAGSIAGSAPAQKTQAFLVWPEFGSGEERAHQQTVSRRPNLFSYPHEEPKVHVRLGSIHSVKGETHTATLVLESFYHSHHLCELKPWILGARTGGLKNGTAKFEKARLLGRLRLHYVAMTRPSHLLGIAMRKDALNEDEIATLEGRGWHIVDCCTSP